MPRPKTKLNKTTPPEKGSFPLDHRSVCLETLNEYMGCLKGSGGVARYCQTEAKEYLNCRIEKLV